MKRDFLSITDLKKEEILSVLSLAKKFKSESTKNTSLNNKSGVLIFEKPSLRTKLSFDLAITQLGGHVIYFGNEEIGLGKREKVSDVAKVVSSMADLVVARVFNHKSLEEFAQNCEIPVINALSDLEHPCQILADLLTILEVKGKLQDVNLAFVGDGENNVTHSLILACAMLGINFACAAPKGYTINKEILDKAKEIAKSTGVKILITDNPKEAVKAADVIYTDTWVSMGDEKEAEQRSEIFSGFKVDQELLGFAQKDAIFMHDMPAYREKEVSSEVFDGKQSVVFQQAENRLYAQKGLISFLFEGEK